MHGLRPGRPAVARVSLRARRRAAPIMMEHYPSIGNADAPLGQAVECADAPLWEHSVRHFIQYHNPDRMGEAFCFRGWFAVFTNKSHSLVASLPEATVWLVGGDGRPRRYFLCYSFIVDQVGAADHPAFRWYVSGSSGTLYDPAVRIDGDCWFYDFLRRQANFSLGLRELSTADREHLEGRAVRLHMPLR